MNKVLLITRNFPPLWGGMEGLNLHMAEALARAFALRLVAPEGAEQFLSTCPVRCVPLKPLSRFLLAAGWQSVREAWRWKPDVVLAGSGLTAPLAWFAARLCGAKAVVYAHGLDLTAPHPVYRALWLPLMKRLDGLIANSRATQALAEKIGVAPEKITIVHPGVALPEQADAAARARFRAQHGLGDVPLLLSVGRLTERKGLREFVAEVLPLIVAQQPNVSLVVVGDAPSDSLYAKSQSVESIVAAARGAGVEKHLRFLGKRFGAELADAYAGADLHVFPVRRIANDPEGFGMVAVEAAAHGVPTVACATGGVVDAVRDGVSGALVAPGDAAAFAGAVCALLRQPLPDAPVRAFAAGFEWHHFGAQVIAFLRHLAEKEKAAVQ